MKTCFESFLRALDGVEYDLTVLLDKPTVMFRALFSEHDTEESYYGDFTEGNVRSFHRQVDLALEAKDNFLLIEDDYYFLPNAGRIIADALADEGEFFITPYDHPGYYTENIHSYQRTLRLLGGHHWAHVISTTLTFGGKYGALLREHETMRKYGWADHPMWTDVTQRTSLYAPVPTLATHMETPHLSPSIDWSKQFN